jgi:mannose-1-phosphate guanylyltransferase
MDADEHNNVVLDLRTDPSEPAPTVVTRDCAGLVVLPHADRVVAAVGVRDLIIVDTPDAVLVCDRKSAQEVKRIVDALNEQGQSDHT